MSAINDILTIHADGESKLTVRTFTDREDEFSQRYVLIEGSPDDLRFLAEVILSHANSDAGCNGGLHPEGAGSAHFSSASTVGIYLHKLPCDIHPERTMAERLEPDDN
jgi:hypothetical protein